MAKFTPRARSIDLLGRQQIAGIPSALNELFKNAHDAYADHVEVDFFRKYNLLVLRDDGVGMTQEDFENRWLTVGTESKLDTKSGISKPHIDLNKVKRPVMGEKGIGRLAIAAIGSQVLVVTRSRRNDGLGDFVLAFINWTMFELPGVNLDEVLVPLKTYKSLQEINENEVKSLVHDALDNLESLKDKTDETVYKRAKKELEKFQFFSQLLNLDEGPSLENGGTLFIISPVSEMMVRDIDDQDSSRVSELHQTLCGFTNQLVDLDAPIKAKFRDHKVDGGSKELIGESVFFTPDDYKKVDHHITGEFDEFGNFKGKLSVYHMEEQDIEFILNKSGKPLSCGPFKFQFGFLQGTTKDSLLDKQDHAAIASKCNKMGGVYVYRDSIRILPYGRPDHDFLGIEKRRSLHAGTYFFNHRRMIGVVDLTRKDNSSLVEKAGREGFMSNLAYREFRNHLEDFLVQLAAKYFNDNASHAEEWSVKKDALNANYEILRKRSKQVSAKKKKFKQELDNYFKEIASDNGLSLFEQKIGAILKEASDKVEYFVTASDIENLGQEIIDCESKFNLELSLLDESMKISNPRGMGMSPPIERLWALYEDSREKTVEPQIVKAKDKLLALVSDLANSARIHLDAKIRLEQSIISLREVEYKKIAKEEKETLAVNVKVNDLIENLKKSNKKSRANLELEIDKKISEVNQDSSNVNLSKVRKDLEAEVDQIAKDATEQYGQIRHALENVVKFSEGSEHVHDGLALQAAETRLKKVETDLEESLENIQLGLAIKIINHEFSSNIKGVRDSISSLKKWSDTNKNLKVLYGKIRDGFDHLDNYLNLFTPLEKRLSRRKTTITGQSICDFIHKLYEERLERHDVELVVTKSFKKHKLISHASTIYPVFINLIDNSIYWLSTSNIKPKKIILDVNSDGVIIADNGPGISEMDREHIYDFGFTRRLTGGGMGLYIASTTLKKEGYDIELSPQSSARGAEFIIKTLGDDVNGAL